MSQGLRKRVETYLKESATPPTRFGREVSNDPRLVFDMRRGREIGAALSTRVTTYLEARGQ